MRNYIEQKKKEFEEKFFIREVDWIGEDGEHTCEDATKKIQDFIEQTIKEAQEEAVREFYDEYLQYTSNERELLNRFIDYVYGLKTQQGEKYPPMLVPWWKDMAEQFITQMREGEGDESYTDFCKCGNVKLPESDFCKDCI